MLNVLNLVPGAILEKLKKILILGHLPYLTFAGLPVCQECQKLSGVLETLPKSQENVEKIDEFLLMSGKCQEFSVMC